MPAISRRLACTLIVSTAALAALAVIAPPPAAAQKKTLPRGVYVVPGGDYGVDQCIAKSAECGRVVASAWCEANGHGRVRAFGSASDITFSAGFEVTAPPRDSLVIACED